MDAVRTARQQVDELTAATASVSKTTSTTNSNQARFLPLFTAPLPPRVGLSVWSAILSLTWEQVLDSFSAVNHKCTLEGRALMSMDVRALHEGLEKVDKECRRRTEINSAVTSSEIGGAADNGGEESGFPSSPATSGAIVSTGCSIDKDVVEAYIKAFYLPDAALLEFAVEGARSGTYRQHQLLSLLECEKGPLGRISTKRHKEMKKAIEAAGRSREMKQYTV